MVLIIIHKIKHNTSCAQRVCQTFNMERAAFAAGATFEFMIYLMFAQIIDNSSNNTPINSFFFYIYNTISQTYTKMSIFA